MAKKKRGWKYKCLLTAAGFESFQKEKRYIQEVKLPNVRRAIAEASEEEKPLLEQKKKNYLKRLLVVNQYLNYSKLIKPAPVDLSSVPTCELHAELAKREGVREIIISPEQELTMTRWEDTCRFESLPTITGPVRILINED